MDCFEIMNKIIDLSIENVNMNIKNNIDQYSLLLNNLNREYSLLYKDKPSKIFFRKYNMWKKELESIKFKINKILNIIEEEIKTLE